MATRQVIKYFAIRVLKKFGFAVIEFTFSLYILVSGVGCIHDKKNMYSFVDKKYENDNITL